MDLSSLKNSPADSNMHLQLIPPGQTSHQRNLVLNEPMRQLCPSDTFSFLLYAWGVGMGGSGIRKPYPPLPTATIFPLLIPYVWAIKLLGEPSSGRRVTGRHFSSDVLENPCLQHAGVSHLSSASLCPCQFSFSTSSRLQTMVSETSWGVAVGKSVRL